MKKEKKIKILQVRISKLEDETIKKEMERLGFRNNKSQYLRSKILRKINVDTDPNKLINDLALLRSELNKIGIKLNQVANHTNFLLNNNYVDYSHIKKLREIQLSFENNTTELNNKIDKT